MTRIAFCDNDAALLHQMQDFLEQYRTLRGGAAGTVPLYKAHGASGRYRGRGAL